MLCVTVKSRENRGDGFLRQIRFSYQCYLTGVITVIDVKAKRSLVLGRAFPKLQTQKVGTASDRMTIK